MNRISDRQIFIKVLKKMVTISIQGLWKTFGEIAHSWLDEVIFDQIELLNDSFSRHVTGKIDAAF